MKKHKPKDVEKKPKKSLRLLYSEVVMLRELLNTAQRKAANDEPENERPRSVGGIR
jgi:hypothetical protein